MHRLLLPSLPVLAVLLAGCAQGDLDCGSWWQPDCVGVEGVIVSGRFSAQWDEACMRSAFGGLGYAVVQSSEYGVQAARNGTRWQLGYETLESIPDNGTLEAKHTPSQMLLSPRKAQGVVAGLNQTADADLAQVAAALEPCQVDFRDVGRRVRYLPDEVLEVDG